MTFPILKIFFMTCFVTLRHFIFNKSLGKQHAHQHSTKSKPKRELDYSLLSIATSVLLFKKACDADSDSDAICRARLAKVVKRDILKMQENFTGIFDRIKHVPSLLGGSGEYDMVLASPHRGRQL